MQLAAMQNSPRALTCRGAEAGTPLNASPTRGGGGPERRGGSRASRFEVRLVAIGIALAMHKVCTSF